jgi:hypothetical protein
MREAIRAHHGAAQESRERWGRLPKHKKDGVIEFLKTLQILPKGTRHRIVNQRYEKRAWPPQADQG